MPTIRFPTLILIIALLLGPTINASAHPAVAKSNKLPPRSGEPCTTQPLADWTEQEKWVWQRVCIGNIADFNLSSEYGGPLDPSQPEMWPSNRVLRPQFIETILFQDPYRSAITRRGVSIHGAWITDPLDLSNATLDYPITFDQSRFESEVNLSRTKAAYVIALSGCSFGGLLNLNRVQVESNLFLWSGAEFGEVDLSGARIGDTLFMNESLFNDRLDMFSVKTGVHLDMSNSEFARVNLDNAEISGILDMSASAFSERLNMRRLEVGSSLEMWGEAQFAGVDLGGAKISGVLNMSGSAFSRELNMDKLEVGSSLFMRRNAQFDAVVLDSAKILGVLDMSTSTFSGELSMDKLEVESSLFMRREAEFDFVDLDSAKIGGNLEMTGSSFKEYFDMDSAKIGRNLLMDRGARFMDVDLGSTQVGGNLVMDGSEFDGLVNMHSVQVEGSLLMSDAAKFAEVELRGAKIGGNLEMDGSAFSEMLNMDSVIVDQNLLMAESEFESTIQLRNATIGGEFDLSGSRLNSLDLTGAQIAGGFRLSSARNGAPIWAEGSWLILRNANVGPVIDSRQAWPENLLLEGFTYSQLAGDIENRGNLLGHRDSRWLIDWLESQSDYSAQPYLHLANMLRAEGRTEIANDILVASKDRELGGAIGTHRINLLLLNIFIGYGYRIHYVIYWFLGLVVLGIIVLRVSKQGPTHGLPYGISYSVDMLLPIIKLREYHYKIDLDGWARYYFYFQRAMGYVLGLFLVAGLSGLVR